MQNEELWRELEEDYEVKKIWVKDVAVGLIAGGLVIIATGWLYFVTVMAR